MQDLSLAAEPAAIPQHPDRPVQDKTVADKTVADKTVAGKRAREAHKLEKRLCRLVGQAITDFNAPAVSGPAAGPQGKSAEGVLRAAKAGVAAIDAQKKAADAAKQAMKELTKVAEDYERKVSTFGSNDPTRLQLPPGKSIESIVDDRFESLRRLVVSPPAGR